MIEVDQLAKDYQVGQRQFRVLQEVSFSISSGSKVAVVGQSGSGKTTLLNLLGGLDTPTSGRYLLGGRDVSRFDAVEWAHERNQTIGFVFQAFHLVPTISALDNVELPLVYRRVPRSRRRTLAAEVLARMGLAESQDHRPTQLSGGEQQRVAIARALVSDPPLILADEPTGNLDVENTQQILQLLKDLVSEGRTLVLVTHAPEVAAQMERVLRISDGRLISDSSNP